MRITDRTQVVHVRTEDELQGGHMQISALDPFRCSTLYFQDIGGSDICKQSFHPWAGVLDVHVNLKHIHKRNALWFDDTALTQLIAKKRLLAKIKLNPWNNRTVMRTGCGTGWDRANYKIKKKVRFKVRTTWWYTYLLWMPINNWY